MRHLENKKSKQDKARFHFDKRTVYVFLLYFTITIFFFRGVLNSPGTIIGQVEWNIPPFSEQFAIMHESVKYSWYPWTDFGSISFIKGQQFQTPAIIYFDSFMYMLSLLGFDGDFISKITSILIVSLMGTSMFKLAKYTKLTNFQAFISGLYYTMNPLVFDKFVVGHLYFLFDYALMPLVFLTYLYSLEKKFSLTFSIFSGILASFAWSNLSSFPVIIAAILIYTISFIAKDKDYVNLISATKTILVMVGVVFIAHIFWLILPITDVITGQFSSRNYDTTALPPGFFGQGNSPLDTLRLLGFGISFFSGAVKDAYWNYLSFIPAILSLSVIILKRENRLLTSFGVMSVFGILLASGVNGPLGSIYFWLINNVSVWMIFRDPIKWLPLTSIGLSILLGHSLKIFEDNRKIKAGTSRPIVVKVVFLILILLYGLPFLSGNFSGLPTHEFKHDEYQLFSLLNEDTSDYRVVFFPQSPVKYLNSSRTGWDVKVHFSGKPFINHGYLHGFQYSRYLFKLFQEKDIRSMSELLGFANIKYLIVDQSKETVVSDDYFVETYFPQMKYSNENVLTTLSNQENIVNYKRIGNVSIFENKDYYGHVFPIKGVTLLSGDLNSLHLLSRTNKENIQDNGIIFTSQLSSRDLDKATHLPNITIAYDEDYYWEMTLKKLPTKYSFTPYDLITSDSPLEGWALFTWPWYKLQYQANLDRIIFSFINTNTSFNAYTIEKGEYYLFLKLYSEEFHSKGVNIYVDCELKGTITPETSEGFRWNQLPLILDKGAHTITFENRGGESAISGIYLAPYKEVSLASQDVYSTISKNKLVILSRLREENSLLSTWHANDINDSSWEVYPKGKFLMKKEMQNNSLHVNAIINEDALNFLDLQNYTSYGISFSKDLSEPIDINEPLQAEVSVNVGDPNLQSVSYIFIVDLDNGNATAWVRPLPKKLEGNYTILTEESGMNTPYYPNTSDPYFPGKTKENRTRPLHQIFLPVTVVEWYNVANITRINEHFIVDLSPVMKAVPDYKSYRLVALHTYMKTEINEGNVGQFYINKIVFSRAKKDSITLLKGHSINKTIEIPKKGNYSFIYETSCFNCDSALQITIGDQSFNVPINNSVPFSWNKINQVELTNGDILIKIENLGSGDTELGNEFILEENIGDYNNDNIEINSVKINPTEYKISIDTKTPFYLVFSEGYHESWKLRLDDEKELQSYPVYSFGNLYFVNKTGRIEGKLEFDDQALMDLGKMISFTFFPLIILAFLCLLIKDNININE